MSSYWDANGMHLLSTQNFTYISNNVGLGITNPSATLDISGNINLSKNNTNTYNQLYSKAPPTNWFVSNSLIVSPNSTNATSSDSWVNNNVTWNSSYSYSGQLNIWVPVDTDTTGSSGWQTGNYSSTGKFTGNAATSVFKNNVSTLINGEWLQIQSNIPLIMSSYILASAGYSGSLVTRMPGAYTIAGSNDGSTWYALQDVSFTVLPSSLSTTYTANSIQTVNSIPVSTAVSNTVVTASSTSPYLTAYTTSTNAYWYFRICVLNTLGTNFSLTNTGINLQFQWRPIFTTPITAGPSNTLLYMDKSNINQLDVSGSLAFVNSNASSITVTPNCNSITTNPWKKDDIYWTVSTSGLEQGTIYKAFVGTTLQMKDGTYTNGVSNAASNSATNCTTNINKNGSIVTMSGDWVQIQSSIPVILSNYSMINATNLITSYLDRIPWIYSIVASNDGMNWYTIQDASFTRLPTTNAYYEYYYSTPYYSVSKLAPASGSSNNIQYDNNNTITYSTALSSYTYFRIITLKVLYASAFSGLNQEWANNLLFGLNINFTKPQSSAVSLSLDNANVNQLNLGGSLNVSGVLNITNGITPSTPRINYPTQVGYILSSDFTGKTFNSVINSFGMDVPPGVWLFTGTVKLSGPGTSTIMSISTKADADLNETYYSISCAITDPCIQLTHIATVKTTKTYYLVFEGKSFTSFTLATLKALRIA